MQPAARRARSDRLCVSCRVSGFRSTGCGRRAREGGDQRRYRTITAAFTAPARMRRILCRHSRAGPVTSRPARFGAVIAVASFMTFGAASAREIAPAPEATYEALFTPGDDIDMRLANLID